MKKSTIFRLNADAVTGYGHLVRCRVIADMLMAMGVTPVFFIGPDETGVAQAMLAPHIVAAVLPVNYTIQDELRIAENLLREYEPVAVVVDMLRSNAKVMELFAANCDVVMAIDDIGENNHGANIILHPGLFADEISYPDDAELLPGLRYWPMRPDFAGTFANKPPTRAGKVFVAFGGSDPKHLTSRVVSALTLARNVDSVTILLGDGYGDRDALDQIVARLNCETLIQQGVSDPWRLMADAQLAICSIGNTSWELACLGVPSIIITFFEGQSRNADRFEQLGGCIHFARTPEFDPVKLAQLTDDLLGDAARLRSISVAGREAVDGQGANRVAERLLRKIRL